MNVWRSWFLFCALALAVGCNSGGGNGGSGEVDAGPEEDAGPEDVCAEDCGGDAEDVAQEDMGGADTAPEVTPDPDICDEMELYREAFVESQGGYEFGDIAGDFTVTHLDGTTWNFAENWTGCESYIFLPYIQNLGGAWDGARIWNSGINDLLTEGPRNVHYFFVSQEFTEGEREARVMEMKRRFDNATLLGNAEERAHWEPRIHFVKDRLTDIPGSVGAFVEDYLDYKFSNEGIVDLGDRGRAPPPYPYVFAIGRDQAWDPGGSLSEYVGGPSSHVMAAYLGHFFNHRAALRGKIAAEQDRVTTINLVDEEVTDRHFIVTAELPSADTMAGFDTVTFDLDIRCPHRNPFGCSEWDRIAHIYYCVDGELCEERLEIARWITQYWRRGSRRWILDASPFLGLMQAGGTQSFRIEMGPAWERATPRHAKIDIRLEDNGGPKSRAVTRLWGGGNFDENYNDNHPVKTFEVPADATRTELVLILSGHGQTSGNNCAEWCDHRHEFSLAGIPIANVRSEIQPGSPRGCAHLAHQGVPPGQWGNWAQGRAYWCPGLPVDPLRYDMTARVQPGGSARMFYRANFAGDEPAGGNISLNVYAISYVD